MYNKNISTYITEYLIDKDIIINENDTIIKKTPYFLLKYKRIIAIILLFILIIIWFNCNIYTDNNVNKQDILKGGYESKVARSIGSSKIVKSIGSAARATKDTFSSKAKFGSALKRGYQKSTSGIYNFGERRATDAKEFAPMFYSIVYSVAITILIFIVFMPALAFFIIGIICYSILKGKISYIKSL